ncbi:hypothetical protein INQ51_10370 [Maribellus sp. CM-23]|uniref:Uncharacterized protein n=1 Tax=Maribellus luteus TaxID=2305463 RepID=A0A399T8H0_9BACT|nr:MULTISPECIES: DUF5908 family protein [Maribellus]MCE4564715.1 hypothetical protein [Maribellus sp. CM-23]RIJ50497.1 hypothetical protein D1614_00750 [Maribellus luteus]
MTLIVKELVIRGVVTDNHSQLLDSSIEKDLINRQLEKFRKELERECTTKVLEKLERKLIR